MQERELNVLIVGLGLIGGSFAAAIKKNLPFWKVVGYDRDKLMAQACLEKGYVDEIITKSELGQEINKADLLIIAIPILDIIKFIEVNKLHFKKGSLIIDVGSTKSAIISKMEELTLDVNLIGGHPMTGKTTAGVEGASAILFKDKIFILTPTKNTTPEILEYAKDIITAIEGIPIEIEPERHDFLVAVISHLPYLIPALLLNSVSRLEDEMVWKVAAGGFRSLVKNVGYNIPMWEDILVTNSSSIIKSLELIEEEIKYLKEVLMTKNKMLINKYLKATKDNKSNLEEQN